MRDTKAEIDDIRSWFDEDRSSKENVVDCLTAALEDEDHDDEFIRWETVCALLALINDPDVTAAFLKIEEKLRAHAS